MRPRMWMIAGAALGCTTLIYAGCSENSAPTGTIDQAHVNTTLTHASTYVPGCTSLVSGTSIRALTAQARSTGLSATPVRDLPSTQAGTCAGSPGAFSVSKQHEHGVTTYSVAFSNFCVADGATGDKSTVNGSATIVDVGTPSDSGPIVGSQTGETGADGITFVRRKADGTVVVNSKVVLRGYTQTFGNPAAWAPGDPTSAKPNSVKAESVVRTDNLTGEVTTLSNLSGTLFTDAAGSSWTIAVDGGRLQSGTHGTLDLATASGKPIVLDSSFRVSSGSLVATGAGGAAATFSAVSGQPNRFTVDVAGQPLAGAGADLDCAGVSLTGILLGP